MNRTPSTNKYVSQVTGWVLTHRMGTIVVLLLCTMMLGLGLPIVDVSSRFSDLLPQQHPYIQTYNEMKPTFGGANVVTMALQVHQGDVFTATILEKIRRVTEEIDKIPGVNHYQVASMAHPKIRRMILDSSGMMKSIPVLPPIIPTNPTQLKRLKEDLFNNDIVYGTYLSLTGDAALVIAGFYEDHLDYHDIFTRLQALKADIERDGEVELMIAGEPMLKGWVYHHSGQLTLIFGLTFGILTILLFFHFRSFAGTVIPLVSMGLSAIWGLGFVGWLGYNLDPLILVVPVLISARTASHCVQLLSRYEDELRSGMKSHMAVRMSMEKLLRPASIAILTDSLGLLVLAVSSIPLIAKVGVFCAFWSLSNFATVTLLVPILLTVCPVPSVERGPHRASIVDGLLVRWAHFLSSSRSNIPILVVLVGCIGIAGYFSSEGVVGDNAPGSPILFPHAVYNVAADHINQKFSGANQLSLYFESDEAHRMKSPDVLHVMEGLGHHMATIPGFGGTRDTAGLVRSINRLYHYDDPRWATIPTTQQAIGNMLFMYEAGAAIPGVILEYMDLEATTANVVVFFKDAKGSTIEQAIQAAQEFLSAHPLVGVRYRFAGGVIGTMAATNEEIVRSDLLQTVLIMSLVLLFVALMYQSPQAALVVGSVLALAILTTRAYMGWRGMGLNINTLPVAAVGIGLGVDYALYMLDRLRMEHRQHDFHEALRRTLLTTGKAMAFTALMIVAGILPWIPISALRFNSEMAMLLGLLMIANMIGALTLLPWLIRVFRLPILAKHELVAPNQFLPLPAQEPISFSQIIEQDSALPSPVLVEAELVGAAPSTLPTNQEHDHMTTKGGHE